MKRIKLIATFVLMIITMATFTIISRATIGTINDDTIKIRREPKDDSTVIDLLYKGDEVEILETENNWCKVKAQTSLGKITGYIKQDLIDVEKEVEEAPNETTQKQEETVSTVVSATIEKIEENKEYTVIKEISIKLLPLINSKEKTKITGNVKVLEILNNWARIENDSEIGWVRVNSLKKSLITQEVTVREEQQEEQNEKEQEVTVSENEQKEENKQPEVTELSKKGYVKAEGLRVRKGPSTDTEEITSLSQNDEVKITGKSGNWYRIDLNGEIGYVSAKYISDTKIAETTSRGGNSLKNEPPIEQKQEETNAEEKQKEEILEETPPITSNTTGNEIVEFAKRYLGYKYVSGGASPERGFDCSGFTTYVYKQFGVSLNRASHAQINNGVAVNKNELQPGDLVIFNNEANTTIGHVGIYIGDGNFIHASNPKDGVKITTLLSGYYKIRYVGARRVI